jgi:hypothetical protein
MATVQVNGSAVVGSYPTGGSTKNKGGVAVKVGSSSTLTNRPVKGVDVGVYGSVVVNNSKSDPALSGGVFAYNNQKPVAKRLTIALATVGNTTLLRGASVPSLQTDINKSESVVTNKTSTAFRNGNFNLFTGKYSSVTSATDSFGNDNEARVSRANPGKLVYKLGKAPVAVAYKAKTN